MGVATPAPPLPVNKPRQEFAGNAAAATPRRGRGCSAAAHEGAKAEQRPPLPKKGVWGGGVPPQRGVMPSNTTEGNQPPLLQDGGGPPRCRHTPPSVGGGPSPSPRVPPGRGGGGAAPRGPTPPAARRGGRRRSAHLIVHGWAQHRGPRSLVRSRRGGFAGRSAGGILFPPSLPPLYERSRSLSVPPHPPPRRLGRRRRLLGRGPSRPRRRRSPHCVSLTGSSPATPPAPAPRNRKPTPPERHPPAANSCVASRLEAGLPPGRRRPPPPPPDGQPLRPIGGGRAAEGAGAGAEPALGQAGGGRERGLIASSAPPAAGAALRRGWARARAPFAGLSPATPGAAGPSTGIGTKRLGLVRPGRANPPLFSPSAHASPPLAAANLTRLLNFLHK